MSAAASAAETARVLERPQLRGRIGIFDDRAAAGRELAQLLREAQVPEALVLAIPAGGVPVAVVIADELGWPLDLAVVSKITLPWNTEAGYGAVAFDGSVLLNDEMVRACGLSQAQVEQGIATTQHKVQRRVQRLRGARAPLALAGRAVLLVDDGLASGFTMRAAVDACRRAGARRICVAVPTAHAAAIEALLPDVALVVCANVRAGTPFAVADAYLSWRDVTEEQAELALQRAAARHGAATNP